MLCHLQLDATAALPLPIKGCSCVIAQVRDCIASNDDKGKKIFLLEMKSSLSQEKSLKAVKTEALGSGVLYPRDPDGESRLKTGHQLFFNLTESVRQNSAEESEKGESRITCGKTAPATSTAQVEELPHRYPARDLKHISQA